MALSGRNPPKPFMTIWKGISHLPEGTSHKIRKRSLTWWKSFSDKKAAWSSPDALRDESSKTLAGNSYRFKDSGFQIMSKWRGLELQEKLSKRRRLWAQERRNYPRVKLEINQMRKSRVPTTTPIPANSGARDGLGVEVNPITAPVSASS